MKDDTTTRSESVTNAKASLASKIGAGAAIVLVAFVASKEGYVPVVYRDPIGRLAACYGHDDQTLKLGTTYTREQCDAMLAEDLAKHAESLDCITVPLADNEKVALVSFAYNVGGKAFCNSTLVRMANAGAPPAEWCAQLLRWTFARGKQLAGLVARRRDEFNRCITPL